MLFQVTRQSPIEITVAMEPFNARQLARWLRENAVTTQLAADEPMQDEVLARRHRAEAGLMRGLAAELDAVVDRKPLEGLNEDGMTYDEREQSRRDRR